MYGKKEFELDADVIGNAIDLINSGQTQKCEILPSGVKVYKTKLSKSKKCIIRIDINVDIEKG